MKEKILNIKIDRGEEDGMEWIVQGDSFRGRVAPTLTEHARHCATIDSKRALHVLPVSC